MPVAMRLPTPYAKKPARKRTPTIRAVRRTLESGRTTGEEVECLEAGIGSTREMSMGVIQSADATSCVGSGRSLEAASGAMTTTTSHITLDTRLTARSGAAERELRTGGRRPGDEGHRDLGGRLACDKARTERGWRGQLRE